MQLANVATRLKFLVKFIFFYCERVSTFEIYFNHPKYATKHLGIDNADRLFLYR